MSRSTVNIALTPHHAMQMLRWFSFLKDAVTDEFHEAAQWDRAGALEALESIRLQVRKNITSEQVDEACAQQGVNELINKTPKV